MFLPNFKFKVFTMIDTDNIDLNIPIDNTNQAVKYIPG